METNLIWCRGKIRSKRVLPINEIEFPSRTDDEFSAAFPVLPYQQLLRKQKVRHLRL